MDLSSIDDFLIRTRRNILLSNPLYGISPNAAHGRRHWILPWILPNFLNRPRWIAGTKKGSGGLSRCPVSPVTRGPSRRRRYPDSLLQNPID